MRGQRVEQPLRDAIGIGVEEAHPVEAFDAAPGAPAAGKAIAQTEVLAVRGGVLADQRDFAHACGGEIFRFAHDGFKAAAAELPAQLRNDAERAGMIAALGDLDVRGVARRGQARAAWRRDRETQAAPAEVRASSPWTACRIPSTSSVPMTASTSGMLLADGVAVALHQAAGDDQAARPAEFLVLGHLEDGVHRLLLCRLDEAAGVHNETSASSARGVIS